MTILITGATSGFGKAIAQTFAKQNHQLIITGRRAELLHNLTNELQEKYQIKVLPLVFDVQNKKAVFEAIASIPTEFKNIDILINNAGLALGRENADESLLEDWETMIDTNVKGLMYVTKAVLPLMIANKQGHIINMGSVAAKQMYQFGNAYCASKAAVDALSQTLRIDLLQHNIKVTAIHPGAAQTEFANVRFKGNQEKADATYKGYVPLSAQDVADVVYYCSTLPQHVCINDVVITCTAQANAVYFHKA
ncbi:MAG: SDR family NAD(P)-dependent oxidoreductase [Chitinophagaceae bacterium]